MPQLSLHFIDIPIPERCLWEELHPEQQQLIIRDPGKTTAESSGGHPGSTEGEVA